MNSVVYDEHCRAGMLNLAIPIMQEDGGDIIYQSFEEETGRVLLQMRGACSGCPSSAVRFLPVVCE